MNTTNPTLSVRGIEVEVVYKDIKNLHIGVYPPLGRVRVAAPQRLDEEQIRLAVIQRLPWIKRHRQQLQEAARQTPREMVTGESHYVWGVRYRLKVIERSGNARITLNGDRLQLFIPTGSTKETRYLLLQDWQRSELRHRLHTVIPKWEPIIGREVPFWSIRRMKTRWGSCNPERGRIWFNLELVKKDPRCLEYVVAHEMVHLLERHHGEAFVAYMDRFLPGWRLRHDELNRAPLGHEEWDY